MDITQDELEFIYYKRGTAGSFREGLYNLFFKADTINQIKLETMWPELSVLRRYSNEPGYWENLQERYKIPNKMGITNHDGI
jgi:hypothetical protein